VTAGVPPALKGSAAEKIFAAEIHNRFLTGLEARLGMTKSWEMGCGCFASLAALGLKPGSVLGTFFAALKALRHPKALRGAEAPLFHGDCSKVLL
jgi:hypothetical protein